MLLLLDRAGRRVFVSQLLVLTHPLLRVLELVHRGLKIWHGDGATHLAQSRLLAAVAALSRKLCASCPDAFLEFEPYPCGPLLIE